MKTPTEPPTLCPDLVIGDIRLVSTKSIESLLRSLGNPPSSDIPFLNCLRVPILRLPTGNYVDLDVLSLCLGCALAPAQPNVVIPPAVPPLDDDPHLWRAKLTLDDLARGLSSTLARLLALRRHPLTDPQRTAILRAARRFTYSIDGLRPLLLLKINDDALLAHLRDALTSDRQKPLTIGDPWRPTLQRDSESPEPDRGAGSSS